MPIDASIPLQARLPQVQMPDFAQQAVTFAQLGRLRQQEQLGALQLAKEQRAEQERAALMALLQRGGSAGTERPLAAFTPGASATPAPGTPPLAASVPLAAFGTYSRPRPDYESLSPETQAPLAETTYQRAPAVMQPRGQAQVYGYALRAPFPGELAYFRTHPTVTGMAGEDGQIVLNPMSGLAPSQQQAVAENEAVRLYLREHPMALDFAVTPEQQRAFAGTVYGDPAHLPALKETLLARILSGDPSAGPPTPEQQQVADRLRPALVARERAPDAMQPRGGPSPAPAGSPATTQPSPRPAQASEDDLDQQILRTSPTLGPALVQQRLALRKGRLDEQKTQLDMVNQLFTAVADAPEADKAAIYAQARQTAILLGLPGADQTPATWGPEAAQLVKARSAMVLTAKERLEQQHKGLEQQLKLWELRSKTGQAQRDERKLGEVEYKETPQGWVAVPKYPGTTGTTAQPVTDASGQPIRGKGGQAQEDQLRTQFTGLTKDYRTVVDAYGRIQTAAQTNTPAADISLVYGYMKLLDPGSVVREGEFATAQNAGPIPERVIALYNQLLTSKGRLSPDIRADFVARAQDLYTRSTADYDKLKTQYQELATRQNLNPENVTLDFTSTATASGKTYSDADIAATVAKSKQAGRAASPADVEKYYQSLGLTKK